MAAAARSTNSRSLSWVHVKIWIGSAVKAEPRPSGLKRGFTAAPITNSGAVSPIARESARITPVAMPAIEPGSTCFQIVCHRVAPSASEPSRIDGGTARIASRATMITTGSTRRETVIPPASSTRPMDNEGEAEDPVDHRRHGREVLDVDLDHAVEPLLAVGVLLEVHGGGDAQRHHEHSADHHQVERPDERRLDAGALRDDPRREAGEEVPGQPRQAVARDVEEDRAKPEDADGDRAEHHRPEGDARRARAHRGGREHAGLRASLHGHLRTGHSYTWR